MGNSSSLYAYISVLRVVIEMRVVIHARVRFCDLVQERKLAEERPLCHYSDVIMGAIASQITSLTIVYLTVYSGANQGKHQSPASLAFVRGIHRSPVNSPHNGPVTRKMFSFDDVIMLTASPLGRFRRLLPFLSDIHITMVLNLFMT